jgi:hypothetical protein
MRGCCCQIKPIWQKGDKQMNHNENGTVAIGADGSAMRRITSHPEPKWQCTNGQDWPPVSHSITTPTPWGMAQSATYFGKGLISYSTAGHGGFHVSNSLLKRIPAYLQTADAYANGQAGWFEEDCASAIVIVCLPEFFPTHWRYNAIETMQKYYPEQWAEFCKPQERSAS